ncbi:MAG TPA: hypothetical protein ENF95_01535 [Candidatus Aenigmarchaeota archaeon]|nr:hypothetical protein [Candidatus Aenigmarchaeota archaeon]
MDIETIIQALSQIKDDRTVPKNIRASCEECIKDLQNENEELSVRINACISTLDEVSNDPNIPSYTRTQIWNIVSMLEALQHSS